jgi:flagellar basal body-associated protein FliL
MLFPEKGGTAMSLLTILIIVVIVLLILAIFGRGRMGRGRV